MLQPNKLHISTKMSGKMLGIHALNTNTLSNVFCRHMNQTSTICGNCYSYRMLDTYRQNCTDLFQHNSDLLKHLMKWDDLPRLYTVDFRINAHGELINLNHLINVHNIASKNPDTVVTLWSKRRDIINKYQQQYTQPENQIHIFSNPAVDSIMESPPVGFDKVFNVVSDGTNPRINCGSRCRDCTIGKNNKSACYTLDSGVDCIIELRKS